MSTKQDTEFMVFGWPSDEPRGGMRDYLGKTSSSEPWTLAKIHDIVEIMENGDWEWTVDYIEAYNSKNLEFVGAWWVTPAGSWVKTQRA